MTSGLPDTLRNCELEDDLESHLLGEVPRKRSPGPGSGPTLQNVVATVNLCCTLDLQNICMSARNAEYNPRRFPAVIMRIRQPKTTALLFSSGKMICTGAKSVEDSHLAARKFARIIQKLGFAAKFSEFKVQNIVASFASGFPLRLENIAHHPGHGHFANYEPELFPGLIYRMVDPKLVFLIFVSGKVVITGAKRKDEITEAFEKMSPVLQQFRMCYSQSM
mmetsp:Transcript_35386/g.82385  ORF Transcript_35386/g.82385 Transcript_35386/m.82385 type:complete len:221 (-) Transcript_35386:604-1266(-)